MAFLNPEIIANGFKPIEQPNPVNLLMQALQIKHAQQQGQLGQMQLEQHQNELQRALGLQNVYKGLDPNAKPEDAARALTQAGYGAEGLKYQQGAADMGKDVAQTAKWNADVGKIDQETRLSHVAAIRDGISALRSLGPNVRPEHFDLVLQKMVADKVMTPEEAAHEKASAPQDPAQLASYIQFSHQQALTAHQRAQEEAHNATLGVTMRGQDMGAATAAAKLATDRTTAAKPPSGYRPTATGLEAIPGGPADLKLQGVLNQDTATLTSSSASMDRLATAANEAMNHPGLAGTTGKLGVLPNIPGGQAANAAALLNTLKSQVAFGVLQDMRNNSKTGGALGNVSDAEGKRLEANLAALEKSQSVEQLKANLQKIIDYTAEAKDRLRGAYNLKHAAGSPGSGPAKTVVRTGNYNGRKVVQYSDGSTEYAP